jgi:hypothetical protein
MGAALPLSRHPWALLRNDPRIQEKESLAFNTLSTHSFSPFSTHALPPPLASLRGGGAKPQRRSNPLYVSFHKDTLSNPTVILEGTPHRTCHIEDPLTALSQTKTKHCSFIVLDCFLATLLAMTLAEESFTLKREYDCVSHQTIRLSFPGSSVRRFAPPKDDGSNKKRSVSMGGIKCRA